MAASIVRPTANRAVHLKFTPRPSSLGESREILRLLSQFGEVEYFKSFKYDALSSPNTAVAIFKEEEAAQYCLQKSPIRFRMGRAMVNEAANEEDGKPLPAQNAAARSSLEPVDSVGPFGLSQTRSMSTSALPTPPEQSMHLRFHHPKLPVYDSRIFQIQSSPARMHFRDQINRGHYHGGFAMDTKSIPQQDLVKRVPYPGLSCVDWKAEEKPWRLMLKERTEEEKGPSRRKTLRELYRESTSEHSSSQDLSRTE